MADGKLKKYLIRAKTRLRRRRELKRRRPTVKKVRRLLYQLLLLAFLAALGTALYFVLSSDPQKMHWGFILVGMIASSVGVVFSLMAAWRSSVADKRTELLLDKLQETQRIVSESPTDYEDVFDLHVLRPMQRASDPLDKSDHLRRIEMHISTPAYGYHVLGFDKHFEFRSLLSGLQCQKQIIVFSPDAHFFHVANTLLWHPLGKPAPGSAAGTGSSSAKTPTKEMNPEVLAACIIDTMDILRLQVLQAEQKASHLGEVQKKKKVAVWTSNTTEFRLTAFRFETETLAFLLLTDQVTLASDLENFHGRALALPVSIHRQVVGDPGDRESFFEQLKTCPYSGERHEEASLRSAEFEPLKWDFLFLRTGHAVIDLYLFNIQCRQVIWAKEPSDETKRIGVARGILEGVVEYFKLLRSKARDPQYIPKDGIQQMRLAQLERAATLLANETATGEQVLVLLRDSSLHDRDPFKRELEEFEAQIASSGPDFINLSKWLSCIYFFISSGFHQSLYATARRDRAPHLMPQAETDDASTPVIPVLTEGSLSSDEFIPADQSNSKPVDHSSVSENKLTLAIRHPPEQQTRGEEATVGEYSTSNQLEKGDNSDESQPVDA